MRFFFMAPGACQILAGSLSLGKNCRESYEVSSPQLPDADTPDIKKWLPIALKKITQKKVIIGHSAGCPLTLSILENINVKIKQIILVAGYARLKGSNPQLESIPKSTYNWDKIKNNVGDVILLNSDNDT